MNSLAPSSRPPTVSPSRAWRFTRCSAVILAVTMGVSDAFAGGGSADDGRLALDAQLAEFAQQTKTPVKTTVTASPSELVTAICAVLLNPANTIAAADIAAGALLEDDERRVRADRNEIARSVVDATVRAIPDVSDTATVAGIARAVVSVNDNGNDTTSARELSLAARSAAVAAALKLATGANAGETIANQVLPFIPNSRAALLSFGKGALKPLGANTAQVKSFVDEILDNNTASASDRESFSFSLARKVITNPAAAGEVIGSSVLGLGDPAIQAAANSALNDPVLAAAAAQIAASTAAELAGTIDDVQYATELARNRNSGIRALVAAGVIKAASDADTVAILNAAKNTTGSPVSTGAAVARFAGLAATGNGASPAKISSIATTLGTGATAVTKQLIGQSMISRLVATSPAAAEQIFTTLVGIADLTPVTNTNKFGYALASATPTNNTVVGAIAAGAASLLPSNQPPQTDFNNKVALANNFLIRFGKAATGISQRIASLVTDKPAFAVSLVNASADNFLRASAIAVGVSVVDPANADEIAKQLVLTNNATKAQAALIAGAVAKAVDVEKAADIGAKLAGIMTRNGRNAGELKISQAPGIASAIAASIQKKPGVTATNRADELGELAAVMVAGVLAKSKTNAAQASLIASIGTAIASRLSPKGLPNNTNLRADRREAADIAGSIAQTISLSTVLSSAQKEVLLASKGSLVTMLTQLVGPSYSKAVKVAVAEVRGKINDLNPIVDGSEKIGTGGIPASQAVQTGKYEIGSVNDPETPKKNI